MIYAFTGKTGSGKTYQMIKTAYPYWRSGIDVYSNTQLKFGIPNANIIDNPSEFSLQEKIEYRIINFFFGIFNKFRKKSAPLPPFIPRRGNIRYFQSIMEIIEVRDGIILFDEAQVLFSARNWDSLPDEFQYKLQQHRKHSLHLLCTTQNMGTIDIAYRRLVQIWYHHETAIKIGEKPMYFGIFRQLKKDIDQLYNKIDDLMVENLSVRLFVVSKFFTKPLYDTFFDVGFERFKTIWQTNYDTSTKKMERAFWIIPKSFTLKDAQTELRSFQLPSYQNKLTRSKTS